MDKPFPAALCVLNQACKWFCVKRSFQFHFGTTGRKEEGNGCARQTLLEGHFAVTPFKYASRTLPGVSESGRGMKGSGTARRGGLESRMSFVFSAGEAARKKVEREGGKKEDMKQRKGRCQSTREKAPAVVSSSLFHSPASPTASQHAGVHFGPRRSHRKSFQSPPGQDW